MSSWYIPLLAVVAAVDDTQKQQTQMTQAEWCVYTASSSSKTLPRLWLGVRLMGVKWKWWGYNADAIYRKWCHLEPHWMSIVSLIAAAFLPKMQLGVTIHKDRSPVTNAHSETSQWPGQGSRGRSQCLSWSEIIDMQEQTVNPEQKNSVYTRIQLCLISHLSEWTLHKSVLGHIWLWDCVVNSFNGIKNRTDCILLNVICCWVTSRSPKMSHIQR